MLCLGVLTVAPSSSSSAAHRRPCWCCRSVALPTRLRERTSSYPCLQPDGREDDGHEGCCRSTGGRAETVVNDEGCRCSAGGRAEVVVNAEGCRCSAGGRDEVGSSTMHGGELDGVDETSWPHIVGEVEDPWRQDVNTHMRFASLVGRAPSTPAWRVVPALERHHRCGGRASVASRCGHCCRFGSRTSTRSVGLAAGRLSVFAAPSLSVGSRARWCCGVTLRRRRRRPAAVLDGAARCCRRWPMPHHQLGASIINVLAYSTTTTWMGDGLDERQWTCVRTNL